MSETPDRSPDPEEPDFTELFRRMLGDADNPAMAEAMRAMGVDRLDPAAMNMIAGQLSSMFSAAPADGLDLDMSQDVARKTVAAAGDPSITPHQYREVTEAVHVAGLWLDTVTSLTAPVVPAAWSGAEWVAATMPMWGRLVGPVAKGVNDAIVGAMRDQLGGAGGNPFGGMPQIPGMPELPGGLDLSAVFGRFEPMIAKMSSSMFGAQTGQAVGHLATEVVSGTEVGLPLVTGGTVALLPGGVDAFAEGLSVDVAQVRLYLAVRETARVRLFADVPWLGPQLVNAVQAYARDISIDTDGIAEKISHLDATDPQAVQSALADGLFSPTPSPAQEAALARLEALLALVEGWVDTVTDAAVAQHLPQAAALGEAVRRRRATGGPAEQLFSTLVGLQLRPRRLRDAANLFAALADRGGDSLRDAVWANPDSAPTASDLDDILGYVDRMAGGGGEDTSELDAALEQILSGEAPSAPEDGAAGGPDPSDGPGTAGGPQDDRPDTDGPDRR